MDQTITALKVQKRNPNRVNIYLDGEFAFGLSRWVAASLKVGQLLSKAKIADLQRQDTIEVAYFRALRYLSYRPRSIAEVEKRLVEAGFSTEVIAQVMERLTDRGYVNDRDFARQWVENRSTFRPRAHRALALELRQKGVDGEAIQQALQEAADEGDLARDAARKYARRLEREDREGFRQRLGGFLARRGFSFAVSAEVIRELWQELEGLQGRNEKME